MEPEPDLREYVQEQRWASLRFCFPQASYDRDGKWVYGALRDVDVPVRAASLEELIDKLTERG